MSNPQTQAPRWSRCRRFAMDNRLVWAKPRPILDISMPERGSLVFPTRNLLVEKIFPPKVNRGLPGIESLTPLTAVVTCCLK